MKLSPFPESRDMLRLLLLLPLSSLLLLQGSNALCVPRASHLKPIKQAPPQSKSSGPSSPVNAPTKPPPSTPSPAHEQTKPSPSTPSPANAAPTKPSPPPPPPVDEPTNLPSPSVPSRAKAPAKPKSSGQVPSHAAPVPAKSSGSGASGVSASIAGLCKKTNYPEVCMSSVQPYLPPSSHLGPADMLLLHIKASAATVDSATVHANQLLASPTMTPYLRSCLETCKDLYDDMKANFVDAKKALAASDRETLKTMISATISDASTCEDGFLEMPGLPLLMGSYDSELSKLTSNCLAFAELI